jgi:PAS domain S-box-containing protein
MDTKNTKDTNELYNLVIDALEDGVWDWDVPTGQAYFTPRYFEMLGFEDNEFPATYNQWITMVVPDDKDRIEAELQAGVASGKKFVVDVRLKRKDGTYGWYSTHGKTITKNIDGSAKRMVGTLTDISDIKNAEAELEKSRLLIEEKFQETNKLNGLTVDRELKMVKMKEQIKELESKIK